MASSDQQDARLDALDVALLRLAREHPRVGILELSRLAGVARATVQGRLARMEAAGVITGYGPEIDLDAAGYTMQAFVTLEIAQGRLDEVAGHLAAIPGVMEAYATTGSQDVLCRVAAIPPGAAGGAAGHRRAPTGPRSPARSCSRWWYPRGCCRCSPRPNARHPAGHPPTGAAERWLSGRRPRSTRSWRAAAGRPGRGSATAAPASGPRW